MQPNFNILVVDDDLKNIQVGINFLKQNQNYRLFFATSGQQALERVKETEFDLILLDILMPTMDGYEVCQRMKSNDRTKHIPIIFLTAKHGNESLMKGFELGGADYITKPFNAMELNARVKTHLELHHYFKQEIAKLQKILLFSQKAETIKFITKGIAHDCRNFMGTIAGNLYLIEEKLRTDGLRTDSMKLLLEGAKTASDNAMDLLQQFFTFSCDDETCHEVVEMHDVLSDIQKIYKDYMRHQIEFKVDILCNQAVILADKLHIEQVLLNMLINAQHAILERSEENPEVGTICLTVDKTEKQNQMDPDGTPAYLVITIEDNGKGMTPATMEHIFDPYFTTRKDSGGSGLGLAVSNNIVQSYDGKIDVDSEPGKGTCFTIYFPSGTDDKDYTVFGPCPPSG